MNYAYHKSVSICDVCVPFFIPHSLNSQKTSRTSRTPRTFRTYPLFLCFPCFLCVFIRAHWLSVSIRVVCVTYEFAIIRVKIKYLAANICFIFEITKLIIPFFQFIPSNNAFLSFSLPMIAKKSLSLHQKITSK